MATPARHQRGDLWKQRKAGRSSKGKGDGKDRWGSF